jgi:hypothetical protein
MTGQIPPDGADQAKDADASIGGLIFDALSARMEDFGPSFSRYVEEHPTDRWLLFSDYVLQHPRRPNDAFVFTVMPGGDYLPALMADFQAVARRDFKDIKEVNEPMLRLLSDKRLFTFCFVIDPQRVITRNISTIQGMLDRNIARLNAKQDASLRGEDIRKMKMLRRKAATQGFNVRLFDNIILAASLAGFISYLICKYRRATRIGWFSDRDSITAAHEAFAHHLYATNVTVFCQRLLNGWPGPALGVNAPVAEGHPLWCDPFLRVPDYFAGLVSAWNIDQNTVPLNPAKYRQVRDEGIANHPNVHVLRVLFKCENDLISAFSQSVAVTRV